MLKVLSIISTSLLQSSFSLVIAIKASTPTTTTKTTTATTEREH
jgi:hypothetical protein